MTSCDHQFICAQLSDAAFEYIDTKYCGAVNKQVLVIDKERLLENAERAITLAVCCAYPSIKLRHYDPIIDATVKTYRHILAREKADNIMRSFNSQAAAFKTQYKGRADIRFREYLLKCCSAYRAEKGEYVAPYLTIMQSSGFGKSRLLKQLAERNSRYEVLLDDRLLDMTVLYLCMDNEGATGFPRTTTKLNSWLFPKEDCTAESIAVNLLKAFTYFVNHSDVNKPWDVLFKVGCDDDVIVEKLEKVDIQDKRSIEPEVKRQRVVNSSRSESDRSSKTSLLVLAIDEAGALFQIKNSQGIDAFQMLRQALTKLSGDVFAVLVDSQVSVLQQNSDEDNNKALFPPYVLTDTMNVMMIRPPGRRNSMNRVLAEDPKEVWEGLVSMGRPLWFSLNQKTITLDEQQFILNKVAASKLLLGQDVEHATSYTDSTLHGVSSLFCRVGVYPRANNLMATGLVPDYMSVLHYMTYKNDAHISSYVSDPILSFGASHLWYQLEPPALESHILPQFKTMLNNGVVDVGNIDEIVARIFLLLAMDAAIMGRTVMAKSTARKNFIFSGQFSGVLDFVDILMTENPGFQTVNADVDENNWYSNWRDHWKKWKIGFSHFVDLSEEPNGNMLWELLDRRAGGIMPPTVNSCDLVIPIFWGDSVSCVSIKVKSGNYTTNMFPHSEEHIFARNVVQNLVYGNIIRLNLNVCGDVCGESKANATTPAQIIAIRETPGSTFPDRLLYKDFDCYLYTGDIFTASNNAESLRETHKRWSFMSIELIRQLQEIANSTWSANMKQQEVDKAVWGHDEAN